MESENELLHHSQIPKPTKADFESDGPLPHGWVEVPFAAFRNFQCGIPYLTTLIVSIRDGAFRGGLMRFHHPSEYTQDELDENTRSHKMEQFLFIRDLGMAVTKFMLIVRLFLCFNTSVQPCNINNAMDMDTPHPFEKERDSPLLRTGMIARTLAFIAIVYASVAWRNKLPPFKLKPIKEKKEKTWKDVLEYWKGVSVSEPILESFGVFLAALTLPLPEMREDYRYVSIIALIPVLVLLANITFDALRCMYNDIRLTWWKFKLFTFFQEFGSLFLFASLIAVLVIKSGFHNNCVTLGVEIFITRMLTPFLIYFVFVGHELRMLMVSIQMHVFKVLGLFTCRSSKTSVKFVGGGCAMLILVLLLKLIQTTTEDYICALAIEYLAVFMIFSTIIQIHTLLLNCREIWTKRDAFTSRWATSDTIKVQLIKRGIDPAKAIAAAAYYTSQDTKFKKEKPDIIAEDSPAKKAN